MDSYNIFIPSIGRRVELINCFKNAARQMKIRSIIVGGDCDITAPALYFTDKNYQMPIISSSSYIDSIIEVCNQNEIAIIIPTIDSELLCLSKNIAEIESLTKAKVLISDERVIETCHDKNNTQRFFEANDFKVPHMYTEDEIDNSQELSYPLFIKPQNGSSSIDAFKVNSPHELNAYRALIQNPIVQDFLVGEEFSVDCFSDFDCNIISIVPRLRIATRSGEISKGRIIKDREIIDEVKRLLTVLKPIGPVTVQCFKSQRGIDFIEINPRFGGGAPMSMKAGADSCKNLYRLLMGERLEYNEEYTDRLLFLRFDSSMCLNEKMEVLEPLVYAPSWRERNT